jgi:hypothetical protein
MALLDFVSIAGAGTTATRDTTGAKILVATLVESGGPTAPSDSESNTWVNIINSLSDFGGVESLWAVLDPVTSATHDFTVGGTVPAGIFAAFSAATSLQFDASEQVSTSPSPADFQFGITPSANDSIFVTGMGGTNNGGSSITLSFTVVDEVPVNGGVNFGIAMAYLELGTAALKNPEWTFGGSFENGLTMGVWVPFVAPGGSTWPGYIAPFGWQ